MDKIWILIKDLVLQSQIPVGEKIVLPVPEENVL